MNLLNCIEGGRLVKRLHLSLVWIASSASAAGTKRGQLMEKHAAALLTLADW